MLKAREEVKEFSNEVIDSIYDEFNNVHESIEKITASEWTLAEINTTTTNIFYFSVNGNQLLFNGVFTPIQTINSITISNIPLDVLDRIIRYNYGTRLLVFDQNRSIFNLANVTIENGFLTISNVFYGNVDYYFNNSCITLNPIS